MNSKAALEKAADVMRRKHFALNTERSYCAWLKRYCDFIVWLPVHIPSGQKLEQFLTALAKDDAAASPRNQAFRMVREKL